MAKDKTNAWKKFGYSFWVTFSVIAIVLGVLGFLYTALSIYEIIFESGQGFWFGLCFFGVFSLVAALLCSKLLPAWAEMVRTFRLLEERFKGAVGATSVAQFVKVDEERKAALVQAVEEKQNETGNAMLKILNQHKKEVEKLTFKTDENINDIMKSVNSINGRLEALENPVILSQIIDETKKMRQELNDIINQVNVPTRAPANEPIKLSIEMPKVEAVREEIKPEIENEPSEEEQMNYHEGFDEDEGVNEDDAFENYLDRPSVSAKEEDREVPPAVEEVQEKPKKRGRPVGTTKKTKEEKKENFDELEKKYVKKKKNEEDSDDWSDPMGTDGGMF